MGVTITREVPDPAEVAALARSVETADGAPPLSDQTRSRLTATDVTHLLARNGGRLVGYAQRDGESAEVAADPEALEQLLAALGGDAAVWSHGHRSRLVGVLEDRGFVRTRELHQLHRPLDAAHPLPADPPLPAGVTVRAFRPGQDDAAWLALNAAAFADHPEQGRWGAADLAARLAEDWFDAAGFLLAERVGDAGLVGFHWTKVHPAQAGDERGLGEVYVLGVAPALQGSGLGTALLVRGLRHLAEVRGCPAALLYVDGDNAAALHVYERDGFVRYDLDVQWRRS